MDLRHALVDALDRGYVDFVDLLIDYGTSLDKLTLADLEQLYASSDVFLIPKSNVYSTHFSIRLKVDYPSRKRTKKIFQQEIITILRIFPINLRYVSFVTNRYEFVNIV